jgi:hypothetical protein
MHHASHEVPVPLAGSIFTKAEVAGSKYLLDATSTADLNLQLT